MSLGFVLVMKTRLKYTVVISLALLGHNRHRTTEIQNDHHKVLVSIVALKYLRAQTYANYILMNIK